jgi:hypothetical protein
MSTFQIRTAREGREVVGADTAILEVPPRFMRDGALLVNALAEFLRGISEAMATNIGELLHHAEYVVTNDPTIIEARGSIHDCDECRAGVRRALQLVDENPDRELLIGTLWWASHDE